MRITRGRVFARAWPAALGDAVGKAAIVGIVEIDGDVEEEIIHGVVMLEAGGDLMLSATGTRIQPEYDYSDSDVDSILRSHSWPRPHADSGMDGGGVLLRRTRAPAASGGTFIIIGLMSTDSICDQTMLDVSGCADGVMMVTGRECARHLGTNGTTLCQVLKRPIWGWDAERWGLVSTMSLETIDECRRYEALLSGSPEREPGETERLRRGRPGSVFHSSGTDERYQRFKAEWLRRHGPTRWDGVETQADQELIGKRATAIIMDLKQLDYA